MIPDDQWRFSPSDLALSSADVHLWHTSLEQPAGLVHDLARLLSSNEQTRAARFHFERDRRRFIVSHGVLRIIVGRYLGTGPAQLRFRYESHGKPYLSTEFNQRGFRFNQAHSNELTVYAFTLGHELGIDVECIRSLPDAEQIAAQFFSAQENIALHALPADQRLEAFFNCWTRKEAYIKAIGDGLSHPLDQFQVSLSSDEPARLLDVRGSSEEAARWTMASWAPAPGYVAALVVEGSGYHLECRQFLLEATAHEFGVTR
jgi:4'-phosphopantetheinyl transferase